MLSNLFIKLAGVKRKMNDHHNQFSKYGRDQIKKPAFFMREGI